MCSLLSQKLVMLGPGCKEPSFAFSVLLNLSWRCFFLQSFFSALLGPFRQTSPLSFFICIRCWRKNKSCRGYALLSCFAHVQGENERFTIVYLNRYHHWLEEHAFDLEGWYGVSTFKSILVIFRKKSVHRHSFLYPCQGSFGRIHVGNIWRN